MSWFVSLEKESVRESVSARFLLLCIERNLLHKHFASFHDVDARLETIDVVGHLDT